MNWFVSGIVIVSNNWSNWQHFNFNTIKKWDVMDFSCTIKHSGWRSCWVQFCIDAFGWLLLDFSKRFLNFSYVKPVGSFSNLTNLWKMNLLNITLINKLVSPWYPIYLWVRIKRTNFIPRCSHDTEKTRSWKNGF